MGKEKQKQDEVPTKGGFFAKLRHSLSNEPLRLAMGVVVIISGLFLTLSFFSFFFTGWEDQSLLKGDYSNEYLAENIKNWTGLLGAKLSDFCINRTFGVSVIFYLFYWFLIGFWLLNVRPFEGKMRKVFFICSFFLVWGSVLAGSFIENYESTFLFLGGEHGYQTNLFLQANVGYVGVVLLLLVTLLIFSFYAFDGVYEKFSKLLNRIFHSQPKPVVDPNVVVAEGENPEGENPEVVTNPNDDTNGEDESVKTVTNQNVEGTDKPEGDTQESNSITFNLTTDDGNNVSEGAEKQTTKSDSNDIPFVVDPVQPTELVDNVNEKVDSTSESTQNATQNPNPSATTPDTGEVGFTIEQSTVEMANDEGDMTLYDPTKDLEFYKKPTLDLFKEYDIQNNIDVDEQNKNKNRIVEVLRSFGVEITSIKATVGPTVTLYEVTPAPGVRIAKIRGLGDDIALTIAAKGIRIIAPIPGKGTIGIEVPNAKPVVVPMAEIIGSKKFQESKFELPIALGKTITNEVFMLDLCKMPHVLVAGATGQGKSVGLNAIITSLLYKKHPSELKFVMVDPKMVEFSMYAPIERHFLAKMPDAEEAIITDVKKVVQTLNSLCVEMDQRYELLKEASVRQLKEYNEKFINRKLNPNKGHHYMPYIVVVIDEFADLIMQVGKDVETPIARIAQKARAVGIHMILATQRPSANIITGVIRANFPARFAFRVSTGLESRVILDTGGAEQLIGRGDMLISQGNDLDRVQCALVDTPEVERIAKHIADQQGYPTAFILPEYVDESESAEGKADVDLSKKDPMFDDAAQLVVATQQGSTSMIQRKFSIGYNRAGRIMDQLEAAGIVGPAEGSKPRQVMVTDMASLDSILSSI